VRHRQKKKVMSPITKWIPPSLFFIFCLSLSKWK